MIGIYKSTLKENAWYITLDGNVMPNVSIKQGTYLGRLVPYFQIISSSWNLPPEDNLYGSPEEAAFAYVANRLCF